MSAQQPETIQLKQGGNAMRKLIILAMCATLMACEKPTLDASSDEAFKSSLEKVSASLPEAQRSQLQSDVAYLAMKSMDIDAIMSGKAPADVASNMRTQFAGKTGEQVIAEAAVARVEQERREREQALAEIQELLAKERSASEAAAQLALFQVTRSRFYKKEGFIGTEPVIELAIVNGTDSAISRAYFRGTIASPGRQVPWLNDTFNYEISGGIEPAESASWVLAPNRFSEWGEVDAPEDAVFTVEVYRLDGPDGKVLYDASSLSERESQRLSSLQERFSSK
tara:strand:- start:2432 stop:3277 length:846 start_codon:yes stop_codon:yes gene_type:complete